MCALCMDPDAPVATIWDNGALVKDTDVTAIKEKVKKNLLDSIEGAKEKHKVTKIKNKAKLEFVECKAMLTKLDEYKPENEFCPNDAGCTATADASVTSAWVVKDDNFAESKPTGGLRRELQAATL